MYLVSIINVFGEQVKSESENEIKFENRKLKVNESKVTNIKEWTHQRI